MRGWINCRAPFNLFQNVSSPCQNASIKNILKKNTSTKNNYKKILSKWPKKKKPENEIESKRVQEERDLPNCDLWEGGLITMEYHFSLFSN